MLEEEDLTKSSSVRRSVCDGEGGGVESMVLSGEVAKETRGDFSLSRSFMIAVIS